MFPPASSYSDALALCPDQVGANSYLELYQLYFRAPGISYACKPLSTVKMPDETVYLSVEMKPNEFISNILVSTTVFYRFYRRLRSSIQVVYGSRAYEAPPGRVREVGGLSDDINYGFGGE